MFQNRFIDKVSRGGNVSPVIIFLRNREFLWQVAQGFAGTGVLFVRHFDITDNELEAYNLINYGRRDQLLLVLQGEDENFLAKVRKKNPGLVVTRVEERAEKSTYIALVEKYINSRPSEQFSTREATS